MKWYVLQVITGTEEEVRDALVSRGFEALAPAENRLLRSGGRWIQRAYRLFPGYVFVRTHYDAHAHRLLLEDKNALRLLGCGASPSPLSEGESAWIRYLGDAPLEPSVLEVYDGGNYRVVEGALAAFEDKIIKVDTHRQRAVVSLTIAGREVCPVFSVEIVKL